MNYYTPKFAEIEQLSVVTKRQNRDAIGSWGCELLNLCCDAGLFILDGQKLGDESREFTYFANGGRNIIDYIVGSPVVWQVVTHLEVIINDTRYCDGGRL